MRHGRCRSSGSPAARWRARLGLFAERPPGLRHVALATDPAGQRRVAARLDRLGIAYHPERHRDSDSIYFPDLDGTVLELMVPRP
jgi:hypothetical protein